MSFEHFLEGLKRRWWPDIGWQAIPNQRCSCVKCKRAEFSFGGWLYQEIWAGQTKLSSWFVMAQQRGQIRWCACAENFVCESSYFEMDPRCHREPVKFIEQWSGTAQSIRLQNDAGQHVLLALKLSGQGLRHAIHAMPSSLQAVCCSLPTVLFYPSTEEKDKSTTLEPLRHVTYSHFNLFFLSVGCHMFYLHFIFVSCYQKF